MVRLRRREEEVRGKVLGVDEAGRLLFRRDGATRPEAIASGEILEFEG
jgi:hypothetical protein